MREVVLLDALGTLVDLRPPWPLLVEQLLCRGVAVTEEEARTALLAEIAFYRGHHDMASDDAGLAELRARCTVVLRDALPPSAAGLGVAELQAVLLDSLRFEAYPDVRVTLEALRAKGLRLVVVSNWDVSLHAVLHDTGLDGLLDAVLTSAECGVAKPEPAIFARALQAVGVSDPARALHVGDTVAEDVAGARAAGIEAVLIARDGAGGPDGVTTLPSLKGLEHLAP